MEHVQRLHLSVMVKHPDPLITAGVTHILQAAPGIELHSAGMQHDADVLVTDMDTAFSIAESWRGASATPYSRRRKQLMVIDSTARELEVRHALENGIRGYVLVNCQAEEIVACVRALAAGTTYLSRSVAMIVAESLTREALTARELDVLRLLAQGLCNKSIARSLNIAIGTVKAHLKAIMGKLGASSRTHAALIATSRGFVFTQTDRDSSVGDSGVDASNRAWNPGGSLAA